jgi:MutS domain V
MMPRLLHPDRDADLGRRLSPADEDLLADLELARLLAAMSGGDPLVADVCRALLLSPLRNAAGIRYRQEVLQDCLARPAVLEELDATAARALAAEREVYSGFLSTPESRLSHAVHVLEEFLPALRQLRAVVDRERHAFGSDGLRAFATRVESELDDDFFRQAEQHVHHLAAGSAVLLSARLGRGNRGVDHRLRTPASPPDGVWERLRLVRPPGLVYRLREDDEDAAVALAGLRNRGVALASEALSEAAEHIHVFFLTLRTELAFYRGCVALHDRLSSRGMPICWSEPVDRPEAALCFRGLYDVCLALTTPDPVVGNDVDADGRALLVVTGANGGGKSTFLRSVGLAQLMMQSGMVVPARAFRAQVRTGVLSHFRREEDSATDSGKLDQELRRMSALVDVVRPGALLLCNESFASTNDREGSEIARQVVEPLVEAGVAVVVVTHLFDLAHTWYAASRADTVFLRAERGPDGERTFRVVTGAPEATSYAEDVYREVFADRRHGERDRHAAGAG